MFIKTDRSLTGTFQFSGCDVYDYYYEAKYICTYVYIYVPTYIKFLLA